MKIWKAIIATLGLVVAIGAFATLNSGCNRAKDKEQAVQQATEQTGNTPLHDAVLKGNLDEAAKLLDDGADVNAANDQGNTPLHFAALSGSADAVTLLVDKGADEAAANQDGKTALDIARDKKNDTVIKALGGEDAEAAEDTEAGTSEESAAQEETQPADETATDNESADEAAPADETAGDPAPETPEQQ